MASAWPKTAPLTAPTSNNTWSGLIPASSIRLIPTSWTAPHASRITHHGFQYVEVTGFPGKPTLDTLRGVFIHSAIPVAGEFECSNPLLNRIWGAGRWAYLSNLQGIDRKSTRLNSSH